MLSLETLEASPRYWPLGNPGSNHRPSSSITVPLTSRPSLADHRGKLLTTGNFQNCFFTAGGLCKEGWKCSSRNTHKVARLFEGNFPLPVTSALIGSRLHHLGLEKGCSSSVLATDWHYRWHISRTCDARLSSEFSRCFSCLETTTSNDSQWSKI